MLFIGESRIIPCLSLGKNSGLNVHTVGMKSLVFSNSGWISTEAKQAA